MEEIRFNDSGKKIRVSIDNETQENQIDEQQEQAEQTEDNKNDIEQEEISDSEKEEIKVPIINLDKVPNKIKIKEEYELPSYYEFDKLGGEVLCTIETGEKVENTSEINVGSHKITCEAKGNNGYTTSVEKEIKVELEEVGFEVFDGYLLLTLYYPKNSTNWQWRLDTNGEIRTGYNDSGWQDYTGPILVKIEDLQNIYIRYNINGETVIESPNNKPLVDIEPSRYTLCPDAKTNVKITYDKYAKTKEYRINGGDWQKYNKSFEVEGNTLIEAKVTKIEYIYDDEGILETEEIVTNIDSVFISEYVNSNKCLNNDENLGSSDSIYETLDPDYSNKSYSKDSSSNIILTDGEEITNYDGEATYKINGPKIKLDTYELAHEVTVTLDTEYAARKIYYKIDNGDYVEYSTPFVIKNNSTIRTYYIRQTDGLYSSISSYRITNLRGYNMPYVAILSEPDPLFGGYTHDAKVKINASDYETLEYSFDGIYYKNYTGTLYIKNNCTIYARATNLNGTSYDKLEINNIVPTVKKDILDISILANPDGSKTDSTKIKIVYDTRSVETYYKVGYKDSWHPYDGEFEVTKNTTIYAYAISDNGSGNSTKYIDFLKEGLNDPVISGNPTNNNTTYETKIKIVYDEDSIVKKYKIDNEEWQEYTKEFVVSKNCVILAYSEDEQGNASQSEYIVTNIIPEPAVHTIDYGSYYLIKLNYPNTSIENKREYKWMSNGEWRVYPSEGIALIKQEYAEMVNGYNKGDEIELVDQDGNKIKFKGDFYVLTVPASQISGNLFMRWDTTSPDAPKIIPEVKNWTNELNVDITYPEYMIKRQYRLVYEDGSATSWLDYEGKIKITKNNTKIYAKCQDELEVWSDKAEYTVTNIDEGNPGVRYINVENSTQKSITINVTGIDMESGIKYYYYSLDGQNYKVSDKNTFIFNNLYANSDYKIYVYVEDQAGNKSEEYNIIGSTKNIEAPSIDFSPSVEKWSNNKKFKLTHADNSLDLYYSLDNGKTWEEYIEEVILNKNTTVVAKASDGINERKTAIYEITTIDTTNPIIKNVDIVSRSSKLIITIEGEDKGSGIKNYLYSLDGINYTKSELSKNVISELTNETEYTIYVKVENGAGLESEVKEYKAITKDIGSIEYTVSPNNDEWAYEKTVIIDYPYDEDNIYKYEYSLDGAKTWLEYNSDTGVKIEAENQTIVARVVDGPNVKIANSLKITMIDRTEPTINLDKLPSEFATTDNYTLPSSYTVDNTKSGGSASCNINGIEYTNTQELPGGEHIIECSVITGAGRKVTITKNIKVKYVEVLKSESIIKAMESDLKSGYYNFQVKTENETVSYPIHLYVLEGNQTFSENQIFGDVNDVATSSTYAQNMVIVKVNGDLTIDEGVTVAPYYTEYGGPKGFTLYVTGKLTNNGTIDNSHGAKAEGQNVYLWKNEDGTYEYVPALGGTGGASFRDTNGNGKAGYNGVNGSARQTGGGGSGSSSFMTWSGAGTAGTSYSGGTGGGSAYDGTGGSAVSNGGRGGSGGGRISPGGAGNPGGSGYRQGGSGTGGLLVIYANEYVNNGLISACGKPGGVTNNYGGGSSGGGSINIFYKEKISDGTINIAGGVQTVSKRGGNGGTGTITYTQIDIHQAMLFTENLVINQSQEVIPITPPKFAINNVSTSEKEISITYPQGYTNEYSIDNGITWNLYTDIIKVDKNITIYARSIDESGKVVSSSSMKVTGIEKIEQINEQEENENEVINISEKILVGEDYPLPTEYKCYINDIEYTNTSTLEVGKYNVMCYKDEELIYTKEIEIVEENNET